MSINKRIFKENPVRARLFAALCLTVASVNCSAAPPALDDGRVAQIVSAMVESKHVSRRKLDDEMSQRAFDLFVQTLDPSKLFFMQADIEEFETYATQLDDLSKRGDLKPASVIFQRLLTRMEERIDVAEELLSGDFNFEIDESAVVDPDHAEYATDQKQARDRWRREIKLQLLILKSDANDSGKADSGDRPTTEDLVDDDPKAVLGRRYRRLLARTKRLSHDKLLERYLTAITSAYDPHTTYMSPGTLDQFMIMMRLNLEGIGAELREQDDYTVITKLIEGGAAAKEASLVVGDKLLAVSQGADGDWERVVGASVEDVASIIRGKSGTVVRLKVLTESGDEKQVRLKRSRVELGDKGATGKLLSLETKAKEPIQIGYLFLPSFYRDADAQRRGDPEFRSATRDVKRLLEQFSAQGADAVVLDLRINGGGFLDEAVNITGLFIDQGPVVQVKDHQGSIDVFHDSDVTVAWNGPLTVLTSKFSASASEIVAGAIKDYRRGVIIGDPSTHGKGTVQTPLEVAASVSGQNRMRPNLGALKVTIQTYYWPNGESTQVNGVKADVVLPSITEVLARSEADLKYALPNDTVGSAKHRVYSDVDENLLQRLRESSAQRVKGSEDFAKVATRRNAFIERKSQTHHSVKQSTFVAQREKLLASDQSEAESTDGASDDAGHFPVDYYDRELVEIVQDYVEALNVRGATAG